jgi:hypothetical protein
MKSLFVSYEIAKKLKEVGFSDECMAFYAGNPFDVNYEWRLNICRNAWHTHKNNTTTVIAPMYQQIMDWFREKKGINIFIDYFYYDGFHYGFKWVKSNGAYGEDWKDNGDDCKGWDIYYEAVDNAIEKAIELIKSK